MPKTKNKGGRPSKYDPKFPELVYQYIEECKNEDKLPLIKDWCRRYGVNVDKIESYTKLNNRFRRAIEEMKSEAEAYLIHKSLKRKVDPNFAKFILAANYGYVETSKQIQEGNNAQVVVIDSSKGYKPPQSLVDTNKTTPTVRNKTLN